MRPVFARLALAAAVIVAAPSEAQEFRSIRPIRKGHAQAKPAGAVEQAIVTRALERMIAAWNTPAMRALLGARFYDADRLSDNLTSIPRDATLRLLGIEAIQVLRQEIKGKRRVSVLSVVARTQVEYEDPSSGFRRLEGSNEYQFSVTEVIQE